MKKENAENKTKLGRVFIMVASIGGSTSLKENLESGVDHIVTIDSNGVVYVSCQKWLRDNSDANPKKENHGPTVQLVTTDTDIKALSDLINAWVDPLVTAQFGPQQTIAPAVVNTPAPAVTVEPAAIVEIPAITIGEPTGNDAEGTTYPIEVENGTGTNQVKLQYSADNGTNYTPFATAENAADGAQNFQSTNPAGVTGSVLVKATITVGGTDYDSNTITVTL